MTTPPAPGQAPLYLPWSKSHQADALISRHAPTTYENEPTDYGGRCVLESATPEVREFVMALANNAFAAICQSSQAKNLARVARSLRDIAGHVAKYEAADLQQLAAELDAIAGVIAIQQQPVSNQCA